MKKLTLLPALLLLALSTLPAQEAARPVELTWSELAPLISGQKVQLALADGAVIAGEAITVREEELVIDVKRTSDKAAHPRGYTPIPRESVTLLKLERRKRKGAKAIGTTVGVVAGVIGGSYLGVKASDESFGRFIAAWTSIASASSIAGYLAGREIEWESTYIKVVE